MPRNALAAVALGAALALPLIPAPDALGTFPGASLLGSASAEAGICARNVRQHQPQVPRHCQNIDMQVRTEGNAEISQNPDVPNTCDLGLSMPGLPAFGASIGSGFDSCAILQAVTGPMVRQVNAQMQDTVNQATQQIQSGANTGLDAATGGNVEMDSSGNVRVSPDDILLDNIQ
ncbi:hypothetical protein J2T57_001348 [Natronocella acetinitrilica]|uniref:Secreted protein n=1 Tax=Natronocella acetinitrilica TaxID=414046 RepID=A0AAE3G3U8_9GAMM|nr:hypothetical protein [Natronocella acetinitrilica]MCP1674246.1 hypothetical protein [Natronocella acetinitrilica]